MSYMIRNDHAIDPKTRRVIITHRNTAAEGRKSLKNLPRKIMRRDQMVATKKGAKDKLKKHELKSIIASTTASRL